MAVLPVIIAPDPRLKVRCAPVKRVDDEVRRLMDDLLETMYSANGVGLAAPQVGIRRRVIVVDVAKVEQKPQPLCLANPEIAWASEETVANEEGCLSFPDLYAEVARPAAVRVRFLDRNNEAREIEAKGILSTCVQHEMDHLEGVLFVDYLSFLKRNIILRKLAKMMKTTDKVAV